MSNYNRLRWKCRRGTLELDLLLQQFLERDYPALDARAQSQFEALLELGDEELWAMIQGEVPPPLTGCDAIMLRLQSC